MGRTDWDQLFSVNPTTVTDDEIEELCPIVMRCDVEEISDEHNLRTLMKLSQEMLQYKDNQVESLLLECGELKETISSLRPEAAKRKKKDREIADTKEEVGLFPKNLEQSGSYEDTMQIKNKKIKALMSELESLETDNTTLKDRLALLTREMEDATEKMNELSEELSSSRMKIADYKDKLLYLEREKLALTTQIEELTAQQVERDGAIDEFSAAIEARISEWKSILDEKDAEINRLKEGLSQSLMQSVTEVKEQNKSQIVHLSEEIERRDRIIEEFQQKLSQAVVEINSSAELIEKLKADAQKVGKSDRRKEQRDLLRKLQDANQKISKLNRDLDQAQEDAKQKSTELVETLLTLKKYEDENQGLTDALHQVKELKTELTRKNDHITDLINVVNKLEMLNSYQEMEIISLREKLGIPEDESISIQNPLAKRKEEAKKIEELLQQNKLLIEENIELKSDIRVMRYKLSKSVKDSDFLGDTVDRSQEFAHSTKLIESRSEIDYPAININELKANMQTVIEENEALRTGMHEILDSIRNQDGKSEIEIQSSTLERLLEALDVRHLAGWYHPAMRLQEHLNVIQGSNAELRGQLKELRKELQKKDTILQNLALNRTISMEDLQTEDSEGERMTSYISELKNLREAYENETVEWEQQKESLLTKNSEYSNEIDKLKLQVDLYEENLKLFEEDPDKTKKSFATKVKEYVRAASEILIANRRSELLQQLLNKEVARFYEYQKESIRNETSWKKVVGDLKKRNKTLESEISTLQSNLLNSVSKVTYDELQEKHEETKINLRNQLENNILLNNEKEFHRLRNELEVLRKENSQLLERCLEEIGDVDSEGNVEQELKKTKIQEIAERQRADQLSRLHEILQAQLIKYEDNIKELVEAKSSLQRELISVNKKLSKDVNAESIPSVDENKLQELRENNLSMQIENENLKQLLKESEEEAQLQYSTNCLKTLELDSLRHQILDLQAISEDKATISRLSFELHSKHILETELNAEKIHLENELKNLQGECEKLNATAEGLRNSMQDCRRQCENRCRKYKDTISFLQSQYAGSTPISVLQNVVSLLAKLKSKQQDVESEMKKAKECNETAKFQQDVLNNRLQIVENLKDILEQQIGNCNVQEIMQRFSEFSQYTLSEFKYKRKISQLESELQVANNKFIEYESIISQMEHEMFYLQQIWGKSDQHPKPVTQTSATSPMTIESRMVSSQTSIEVVSIEVQTDPYTCCLSKKDLANAEIQVNINRQNENIPEKLVEKSDPVSAEKKDNSEDNSIVLREQLNQTLKLASERSAHLIKCESQITEYQAKIDNLSKTIENKNIQLTKMEKVLKEYKTQNQSQVVNLDCSDKLALKSTINSLQKLVSQKEETIGRYQNLLKEDREEHAKEINQLQEELKDSNDRILSLQNEIQKSLLKRDFLEKEPQKYGITDNNETLTRANLADNGIREEEVARLNEKISTLDADLKTAKELSERWHRLAEERLHHVDQMRERLEDQHKSELESYRSEINKWQTEADTLRKQLSENRILLTKGNISLMKELQERDNKIHELSLTCQQLQNEVELLESSTNRQQQRIIHNECEIQTARKTHESSLAVHREPGDLLRKQMQSLLEREKSYKQEITELKQQLSRRYMATKLQEKKVSQREIQLERKVKTLEDELEHLRDQLDRECLIQEAKRAKTAEELSLWEKQKKWQQTAEKLKEKLKEKTEECAKLLTGNEKLRAIVTCMEREKWYLQRKLKVENSNIAGSLSARPVLNSQNIVEELQRECQKLKSRIKELTSHVNTDDNTELLLKIEEQRRRIVALEAVSKGNSCIISQLEKLEMTKDILEKMNLKLESENFELRLELEKAYSETPRLREKVEHLQKYIELLKVEKSSDSSPRSSDKDPHEHASSLKKSSVEMEKTIFTLKRIIEKLQVENKRLKAACEKCHMGPQEFKSRHDETEMFRDQYEDAQRRIVTLETDLQLAEQRMSASETIEREDDEIEIKMLKQQLEHKSELLDKMKNLLAKAAVNEKNLRQRLQQLELKPPLSTIPESYAASVTPE